MENNDSIILRSGLAIGGIVLLALLSMLSAMLIAESSKGDATAINLAGSLRMQSYRIATRLQDPVHHADPAAVAAVSGEIQAFESRLEQLWRTGAISTAMADSRHQMLRTLESAWREKLRPTLQAAAQAAPFPNHLREIDEFVARLDAFVKVLEQDSEAKIRLLRLVQGIALFLTLVLAFVAMHQLHSRVVVPLRDLVELARRARHGDLSVRIRHVGQDELGVLGQAFNLMAADLSTLYADLEARVEQQTQALRISNRSLELLYHTTRQLSESRLRDATYQAILSEVEKMTGLASVRLCLLDPATTQATRVFTAGPAPAPVASFCEYPRCQSCLGEGFTHTLESSRQTFCIPVRDQDRQFGVLIVRSADLNTTAWQLPLLEAVARNLAAALYVNEQAEQVQRLALLEERNAMARDLHDSLAQALSYLKIQVSRLQTSASGAAMHAETQEIIAELRQGLNNAYRQLRELITTFRLKMQHSRLEDSLRGVVQELSQQSGGLLIQFDHADWTGVVLNPNEQIHLLQIIREALNNVVKHARATQARVRLRSLEDGEVMVEIDDDGIGLPDDAQKTHHFGLSIMHERATYLGGTLRLHSRPGCGVNVHLRFRPAARTQISP